MLDRYFTFTLQRFQLLLNENFGGARKSYIACTLHIAFCVLSTVIQCIKIWVIPPGWGTICDGVNCYIRQCTIYHPWLWLIINIVVISYWRWRDWFHSNLKNCECALIIKDNRWYIYGCNNWHRHKSCPNLVEWPRYMKQPTCESLALKGTV